MNTKTIYTKNMALFLRNKGFKILKTVPDDNMPNFYNWIFEDTQELHEAMSEYSFMYCKNNKHLFK